MTTAIWAPVSMTSYFDTANGSVKQVSLYFYRAGTLDPITVWTTSDQSIPHPIPVITTGYGRVPPIWIGPQGNPAYRIRVFDQYSTLCEDIDNIPGPEFYVGPGEDEEGGTIVPGDPRLYATGDLIFAMSNSQPRAGAVLCNGAAIGPTGSVNVGTGGRANNDTEALFKWLWGQDLYGLLPVIPSRGATAQGDWDLAKAITVPDLQGRTIVGMDAMGVPAKNRLANVPFQTGDQGKMAATGGEALHTLTAAQVPDHAHTVTQTPHAHTGTASDHVHNNTVSISSGAETAHQHYVTGNTDTEAAHTHSGAWGGVAYAGPGATNPAVAGSASTTGAGGAHNHAIAFWTRAGDGAHGHNATHNAQWADRALTFTTSSVNANITVAATTGGGGAHNNTQPVVTVCVYIKL